MAQCIFITGGTWNEDGWSKVQRNVGPYRLATELDNAGYSTFVFDYVINFTKEEILEVLDKHIGQDTLWVGFSSTFFWLPNHINPSGNGDILEIKEMWWTQENEVNEIIAHIKNKSPAKILYGGTKSEFFIGKNPLIDYWVSGLADKSIVPLTEYLKTKDESLIIPPEVITNVDGSISYLVDSSKYPEPGMHEVRTLWKPEHNIIPREGLPIEFARGCIFKCKFCTYPLLGKKKGTYLRNAMEIRDDLMRNYDLFGTTDYFISDDTVNDDTDKLISLADAFKTLPFKPRFGGFFRLDLINRWPEQAEILLDMGVVGVFFGIETLHPESAKSIGKGLHPKKVVDRMHWLKDGPWKNRVNIGGGIILGLPHDNITYFEELIEQVATPEFPMDHVQFFPLHLNDQSKTDSKPGLYVSEFNLHPEIYGYEFPGKNNYMRWQLPQQDLSHMLVSAIAQEFNQRRDPLNKPAGFEMIRYLNIGIDQHDLHTMTSIELRTKYKDLEALNQIKLTTYKKMLLGR